MTPYSSAFIKKVHGKSQNDDSTLIFGEPIQLSDTKSGHNIIPISQYNAMLNNVTTGVNTNITLLATDRNKSMDDITLKLHR